MTILLSFLTGINILNAVKSVSKLLPQFLCHPAPHATTFPLCLSSYRELAPLIFLVVRTSPELFLIVKSLKFETEISILSLPKLITEVANV